MVAGEALRRAHRLDPWAGLRVALAVLWIAWAAFAWWTAPRPATDDEVRADLAGHRVVAAQWATGWDDSDFWGAPPTPRYASEGYMLVYRTTDLRVRHVDLSSSTERNALHWTMRTEPGLHGSTTVHWVGWLGLVLVLVGLAVLLGGPAPAVGTRWYWFWMGGVPFGLGLLYWLAVERPWAHPAPPAVDPKTNKVRRRSGLTGFAFMILSGIALSILAALLGAVVGDFVVPTP